MFENIYDVLVRMNDMDSDEIVLVFEKQKLTRGELLNEVDCLAEGLSRRGLKKGEKVGIILENCKEFVTFYFALAKKGLIMFPINWKLDIGVINELIEEQNIKYLVYDKSLIDCENLINGDVEIICDFLDVTYEDLLDSSSLDLGSELPEVELDSPFVILLTSGTSGKPKQIVHTHRTLLTNAEEVTRLLEFNSNDVFLFSMPLYSMFGIAGILFTYISRGRMVLQRKYNPLSALQIIQEEKVTVHNGNISMFIEELEILEKMDLQVETLRIGMIGGSVLPSNLIKEIEKKLGMLLCITYGMTENAGAITLVTPTMPSSQRYSTVGKPLKNTKVKIVNSYGEVQDLNKWGEILIQTPSLSTSIKESWFNTQDIGFIDENGNLNVVGRKKDIFIRNNKVSSLGLLQAKMFNLKGIKLSNFELVDNNLILWVVLKDGYSISKDIIFDYCRENFFSHEIPDSILICDEFPITGSGKVDREKLKKQYLMEREENNAEGN